MDILIPFIAFTAFVAFLSWYKVRNENLDSADGYFLGGRSLTGAVIAGSMIMTNISTEHLIGMNGSSYKNGSIIIAWEVTSSIALVIAALYFVPKYLKMGLTTIPEYLERRFDRATRTIVASFLIISFAVTLLPIVLYTGAINLESLFSISDTFQISKAAGIWYTVLAVGTLGSVYAVFGGLKAVAYSDMINGYGLLLGGILVPLFALYQIGDGNMFAGFTTVFEHAPEKFNVIGSNESVLPIGTLFTGLMINQLYFFGMNQAMVQRVLGAKNLKEAQKGLIFTGILKMLVPMIIVLPGIIGFYYYGDSLYDSQDIVYPMLVKKVLPVGLIGIFAAVVIGAVLTTFNSVLNSAATLFSVGIYKRHINTTASEKSLVSVGRLSTTVVAVFAIGIAPFVAKAPDGLYQLMQQLNGIFFIPIASIILAGFFLPSISANAAKAGLFFGLFFYILTIFILEVDIHFVHIWGIEFVLNFLVMFAVARVYPNHRVIVSRSESPVELEGWKYSKPVGLVLIGLTILAYVFSAVYF